MSPLALEMSTERPPLDVGATYEQVVTVPGSGSSEHPGTWKADAWGGSSVFTHKTVLRVTSRGRKMSWPLAVEIRRTPNYVSVADPVTGIHGVGESLAAAMTDFFAAFRDFRDTLARQPDLSPSLRDLLVYTVAFA